MTVYIDDMNRPYGRMIMCHMIADSLDELHEMAVGIGLRRAWFQDKSLPHYDVSKAKKKLAISKGAVEVTSKELVKIGRKIYGHKKER